LVFGYVHDIDPVLADLAGLHLWWYGLGFALGFLQIHRFLVRGRIGLGLSRRDAWTLSILIVAGGLVGGRTVEIAFDEWPFYRAHPVLMPAFWLGGMATHGLLIGAAAATGFYAVAWKKPFLALADTLCAYGTGETRPPDSRSFTTVELKTNFLGTVGAGGAIAGEARPAHLGRTTQVWDAVVTNEATGKRIALFRCTQLIMYGA